MKKLFLILSVIFFEQKIACAQDKIFLLDKSVLEVKVIESKHRKIIYKSNGPKLLEIEKKMIWYISYNDTKVDSINSFSLLRNPIRIHFGVIPYQILSRSSGLYFSYKINDLFSVEYRPTYTYATRYYNNRWWPNGLNFDWFFYNGINNNFLFFLKMNPSWKVGVLLGYKYWWYQNNWIYTGREYGYGGYVNERRSSNISGPQVGLEFQKDIGADNFDATFFVNASVTFFNGTATAYEANLTGTSSGSYNYNQYPATTSIYLSWFNIAAGFKVGYRK